MEYIEFNNEMEEKKEEYTREQINDMIDSSKKILNKLTCINEVTKSKINTYIYQKNIVNDVTTRNDRKGTFKIVYSYCVKNNIIFDPQKLVKELGLKKKDVTTCLREISNTSKNKRDIDKIPVCFLSVKNFYDSFIDRENIKKENIEELDKIIDKFYKIVNSKKLELLKNVNPQILLGWIIKNIFYKNSRKFYGENNNIFTKSNQNNVECILFNYKFDENDITDKDLFINKF